MEPINSQPEAAKKPVGRLLNIVILLVILGAIPVTVSVMAWRTRQETQAAQNCRQPSIPDPADCVGGQWQIVKNESDGCLRFRCVLK